MDNWFLPLLLTVSFVNQAFAADPVAPNPGVKNPSIKPKEDKKKTNFFFDHLSGHFNITSNYMFRGLTQTENLPAVQGGSSYKLPIGVYVSIWGSNVKFINTDLNVEFAPGFGYYKELSKDFNVDLSLHRYCYPSAKVFNYNEFIAIVNFKFLQGTLGYSSNVYDVHRAGTYFNGGINWTIPKRLIFNIENITLMALMGRYNLPDSKSTWAGGPFVLPNGDPSISYNDFSIALSKAYKGYTFSIEWTNTTESLFYKPYGGPHILGTVTYAWGEDS